MRLTGNVSELVTEAQTRAAGLVATVLNDGPTKALLALYVARAEIMRLARDRIPAAEYDDFLVTQRRLEREFDRVCEALQATSKDLAMLARGAARFSS